MIVLKHVTYCGFTDVGLRRKKNEDAFIIHHGDPDDASVKQKKCLFAVADGIGGHSCGDQASTMACASLKMLFDPSFSGPDARSFARQLEDRIHRIDRKIRNAASKNPQCKHMGTTLSVMVLFENFGVTAHVGDTRIYRLRNGHLSQLTVDHTFVQEMIEEGEIPADAAATHPLRNMLTRAVGTQMPLEQVDTRVLDLAAGDRFLISSDGLHKTVSTDEIAETIKNIEDPKQAGEHLLHLAFASGGKDNITGLVIHIQ